MMHRQVASKHFPECCNFLHHSDSPQTFPQQKCLGGIGSLVLLKLLDVTIGLRVPAEEEQRGLDITAHGEEGYMLA